MKERETFGSRLGFILVSAGCAVGLGNVWKFPYMTGKYGGAAFILIYLVFLVLLGLPILVSEFAVGRSSRLSTARAFHDLEPEGANFHNFSYMSMVSNYVLMMFYTMVAGWMLYYCYAMAAGKLAGKDSAQVADYFTGFSWYNDFMDDHCSCSILRSVLFGSAAWPGENHKSYDDMSSGTDRSACGSFSYA